MIITITVKPKIIGRLCGNKLTHYFTYFLNVIKVQLIVIFIFQTIKIHNNSLELID